MSRPDGGERAQASIEVVALVPALVLVLACVWQAALAGLGPVLFGFADEPEAKFFYGQAASEAGVIATTDWNAA